MGALRLCCSPELGYSPGYSPVSSYTVQHASFSQSSRESGVRPIEQRTM